LSLAHFNNGLGYTNLQLHPFRRNNKTNLMKYISLFSAMLTSGLVSNLVIAETYSDFSGNLSFDSRWFTDKGLSGQDQSQLSVALDPEFYLDSESGNQRLVIHPFYRYDNLDEERTHGDFRELYWRGSIESVDLMVGLGKVFWGVTESQHLVDVINQTDGVENLDGEDKLGQPMVHLSLIEDWGTLEAFVLPLFREQTSPGIDGRLRTEWPVDTDHPLYQSDDEDKHVDYALRWSHYIGDWDIGIAHFSGTSRNPIFIADTENQRLLPYYWQMDQTSLDLQATKGSWLWKLEAVYNQNDIKDYTAAVGGFEYTSVGVFDTDADLGWLLEYHYDDRGDEATMPLEDDYFAGIRWVRNDVQSSEMLVGVIVDADTQATMTSVEGSRRLGESWKLSLEGRFFSGFESGDQLYGYRQDDYIEVRFARFF